MQKVVKHNDFLNLKKSQNSSQGTPLSRAASHRAPRDDRSSKSSRSNDLVSTKTANLLRLVLVGSQGDEVAAMGHGGDGGIWIRAAVAVAAGGAIAARAVRRKSVDFSAVFVGVPAMVAHTVAGYRFERRPSSFPAEGLARESVTRSRVCASQVRRAAAGVLLHVLAGDEGRRGEEACFRSRV